MYSSQRRIATELHTTEAAHDTRNSTSTALPAMLTSPTAGPGAIVSQSVLAELVGSIRNHQLREFLETVLHEPLIHGLITTPLLRPGHPVQFPIQVIRGAAHAYSLDYARTAQEKDLLTVAAVLWGMRSLLPLSIYGDTDVQDVFCTLIRSPLHRLDDRTYQVSSLLRSLIGLGDEAAEDESLVHLHMALARRIKGMHASKAWLLPSVKAAIDRHTVKGVLQFAERAAAQ